MMLLSLAQSTQPSLTPTVLAMVFTVIFVALVFDFLNGFHDAANSIATIVSTRVLSPSQAVAWAAFFNFVAAFAFGTGVAKTIGKGLVNTDVVNIQVVFCGLMGAIIWNIITWWLALPSSSSHALVAGVAGAAITKGGVGVLLWAGWLPLVLFIFLSPLIGMVLGVAHMVVVAWLFRHSSPQRVDGLFRRLQLVSAAIYSLGHGGNDAQKTMGIIVMLLTVTGLNPWITWGHWDLSWAHVAIPALTVPGTDWTLIKDWTLGFPKHTLGWPIILVCHAAIAAGTMCGGWRIVKTMGSGITRLQPVGGFCAETAAAITIIGATGYGVPISTTHAITGAILGVGSARSVRSVRWIWGQRIILAWILTLPCSAFIAAVTYLIVHVFVG